MRSRTLAILSRSSAACSRSSAARSRSSAVPELGTDTLFHTLTGRLSRGGGEPFHGGQLEELLHLSREVRVHLELPTIRASVIEGADQQVDAGAIHETEPREVEANGLVLAAQLLQPVLKDRCRSQV